MDVCIASTNLHLVPLMNNLKNNKKDHIHAMAQDVSMFPKGAFTGNVTADQLKDIGVNWTITGHSERRTLHNERSTEVAAKTVMAIDNGLKVILCVGEQL